MQAAARMARRGGRAADRRSRGAGDGRAKRWGNEGQPVPDMARKDDHEMQELTVSETCYKHSEGE